MTQGDYVVLACEGFCLCGVDVAAPQQLRFGNKPLVELLTLMQPQLVATEVGRHMCLCVHAPSKLCLCLQW